jgi:2-amino-4-hydroxy-6-hydroxymethyldihydropteridine diphosphokinase
LSHTAYIGIGTNLGDRFRNYKLALEKLSSLPNTRITRKSSLYESEPHGKARNWFVNGVVEVTTELEAIALLKELQKIEVALGRKREPKPDAKTVRAGATGKKTPKKVPSVSREMDLDILLFDHDTIDSRILKVPHPGIADRKFVLLPLAELAPALVHPVSGTTVSSLLATTQDTKKVMLCRPH